MNEPRTSSPESLSPAELYKKRHRIFEAEARNLERRSRRLSILRLAVFSAGVLAVFLTLFPGPLPTRWEYFGVALAAGVFVVLMSVHDRVLKGLDRSRGLARIQEEAYARLDRRWDDIPLALRDRRPAPADPPPPFAQDLDLFGHASLVHLLGTAETPAGAATLDRWLLEPAPSEEIRRRQEAIQELAGEVEFRQTLQLLGRLKGAESHRLEDFLDWAEGDPWWLHRRWGRLLVGALSLATPILGVAAVAGAYPLRWFLLLLLGNLAFSYGHGKRIHAVFARVSERERPFARYARVFRHLTSASWRSPLLRSLEEALEATGATAFSEMQRLHGIVEKSDLRFSSIHFLVQAVTLWDFHVLAALERWQNRVGGEVRRWFDVLGQWEALGALGGLAFDHPAWTWPVVDPAADSVKAVALGHPLLPSPDCVANDVEVGPPGTFLLVTGSNMSGKSTLLRALGLNTVLAQAGAPVCAEELRLPPLRLGTSIRVEDSLEQGTSFFLAELQRLKAVVDAAEAGGPRLLYLLDEILRGTNSAERRVAVQRVVEHLVEVGALGAVSTHDLELAELPALAAAAHPVHFRETLHSGEGEAPMTFDYRLREGVATTRNALKLLEMVGLSFESPQSRT